MGGDIFFAMGVEPIGLILHRTCIRIFNITAIE
jgi:hypothetical protein